MNASEQEKKFTVGQTVLLVYPLNIYRGKSRERLTTITKIGKKYIYIDEEPRYQFEMPKTESRNILFASCLGKYGAGARIYIPEEYNEWQEKERLYADLRRIFSISSAKSFTLEQLRQVVAILGVNEDEAPVK